MLPLWWARRTAVLNDTCPMSSTVCLLTDSGRWLLSQKRVNSCAQSLAELRVTCLQLLMCTQIPRASSGHLYPRIDFHCLPQCSTSWFRLLARKVIPSQPVFSKIPHWAWCIAKATDQILCWHVLICYLVYLSIFASQGSPMLCTRVLMQATDTCPILGTWHQHHPMLWFLTCFTVNHVMVFMFLL